MTYLLKNDLHKPELSKIKAKWFIKLLELDIEFRPLTTINPQVLADFIAEFSLEMALQR